MLDGFELANRQLNVKRTLKKRTELISLTVSWGLDSESARYGAGARKGPSSAAAVKRALLKLMKSEHVDFLRVAKSCCPQKYINIKYMYILGVPRTFFRLGYIYRVF